MVCSRLWMVCSRLWMVCSRLWMVCSRLWMVCSRLWMVCSRLWMVCFNLWMVCFYLWMVCSYLWIVYYHFNGLSLIFGVFVLFQKFTCKFCSYFQKLCSFVLMFWNQFVYFIHLDAGWSTKSTKWGTKTWLNLPRGGQKSLRGGQKFFARCARDILNRASRDFLYFVSFVPFFLEFCS